MAVGDWISNLFQAEQTRGLSGGGADGLAFDGSNSFYNFRLRRHAAGGDVVADVGLLWATGGGQGLGPHILANRGDGHLAFTDVLLILSLEDYTRAVASSGEPWIAVATRALMSRFDELCRNEALELPFQNRRLGFRILCDGSADMGGQAMGLRGGEFVTGLLPNTYTGPVRGSQPLIGLHVNLPGIWDGYQEVGRLYNDQVIFTLGNHWLDNFSHPSLREAALYRIQRYPDGTFVHAINPDLQDRYQVASTEQGGASILTLATREGEPLAYLVLTVVEATAPAARPSEREDIAAPMMLDEHVENLAAPSGRTAGGRTILPDAPQERVFSLQERGALLQKVHFAEFMEGYDVYVGPRGELGTAIPNPAATFQVRKGEVALLAHIPGVTLDGRPVRPGIAHPIESDVTVKVGEEVFEYRNLRGLPIAGWPYVGEIRRAASATYMVWGGAYKVGRSRECRVVLPDEPQNDNIHWKPDVGSGAMIRARTGDIPKSRFYTDSIMVGSEHAEFDLAGDVPVLHSRSRHCYVYVRRQGQIIVLHSTKSGKEPIALPLEPGDEVLIGNSLFYAGFSRAGDMAATPAAPDMAPPMLAEDDWFMNDDELPTLTGVPAASPPEAPKLSNQAAALAAAVDDLDFGDEDPTFIPAAAPRPSASLEPPPLAPPPTPSADFELDEPPVPAGLGHLGSAPELPQLQSAGVMSFTGALDDFADFSDLADPPAAPAVGGSASAPPAPPAPFQADAWDDWDEAPDLGGAAPPAITPPAPAAKDEWEGLSWDDLDAPPAPAVGLVDAPAPEAPAPVAPPPAPAAAEDDWSDADLGAGYQEISDDGDAGAPAPEPAPAPVAAPEPAPAPVAAPAPAPSPAPAPAPATAQAAPQVSSPTPASGEVVAVDDEAAQFELGRRLHLVHVGWMVNGAATVGNHSGADLVLPENRISADQTFQAADYFQVKVRGRRGHVEALNATELRANGAAVAVGQVFEDLDALELEVIRRDDEGEEDFTVRMRVSADPSLPDPRARLITFVGDEPLAAALVTRGLPTRQARTLEIDGLQLACFFDGERVEISGYLDTYRRDEGFRPFFLQTGGGRFQTAPEDGAPFGVAHGDRLVIGAAVFEVRKN